MTRDDVWNLFKKTGKLEYFIKYQQMVDSGVDKIGDQNDWGLYYYWKAL